MKVEKKCSSFRYFKIRKNVQITLDEDMNVPDTRPDVEKIIESRESTILMKLRVLNRSSCACGETSSCRYCI